MPDVRDPGYRVESSETPPLGTRMGSCYRQYKSYDADAYEAEEEYKRRLKDIPKAPKKKLRPESYRGKFTALSRSPLRVTKRILGAKAYHRAFSLSSYSGFCPNEAMLTPRFL